MQKLLPPSNREQITFRLSKSDRPGFSLLEVDVSKLDAAWRTAGESYISPDGKGSIHDRLERFAEWLAAHPGMPVDAPWVYLDGMDRVAFADGRHRFSVLRDRGYRTIKVAVRKKQAKKMQELFGPKIPNKRKESR